MSARSTPDVGTTASRSRTVSERDIELFTEITGGATVLDGRAVVWTEPM